MLYDGLALPASGLPALDGGHVFPKKKEWRGAPETRAQARRPTPQTSARSGRVQAEHTHKHTNAPAHTSQSGGVHPKPEPKHTDTHRTAEPGVAGYKCSLHTNTHTPEHLSQDWRGAPETRAQAHTPGPRIPARIGGVRAERAHKHTQTPTPQPGVARRSRNPGRSTHTHTAQPSQEGRGTSGARTQTHTDPNTPARSARAQRRPEPKHTQRRRTPEPGLRGYRRGAHTTTHAPEPQLGMAGCRPKPKPIRTHHKHQPGMAGLARNPDPNTSATHR